MSGFTLDTGALIAAERGKGRVIALLDRAARKRLPLSIPAGVLARAWRADPRQHRLHLLMSADEVSIVPLDRDEALSVGAVCGQTGTADVIDVSVVTCARHRGQAVVTSDPGDITVIDARLVLIEV